MHAIVGARVSHEFHAPRCHELVIDKDAGAPGDEVDVVGSRRLGDVERGHVVDSEYVNRASVDLLPTLVPRVLHQVQPDEEDISLARVLVAEAEAEALDPGVPQPEDRLAVHHLLLEVVDRLEAHHGLDERVVVDAGSMALIRLVHPVDDVGDRLPLCTGSDQGTQHKRTGDAP